MKIVFAFILMLANCHTDKPSRATQLTDREGDVQVQTCSRGCYQYILRPTADTTQRFYVTNFPDSLARFALDAHNNQQKLRVRFSGSRLTGTYSVQGAGPDDRPTPLYKLPGFQLERISRLPGKTRP